MAKKNKEISIKINGSGTKEQIMIALRSLSESIGSYTTEELVEGQNFEDETLFTEMSEAEDLSEPSMPQINNFIVKQTNKQ